jgi:hypothetical protein
MKGRKKEETKEIIEEVKVNKKRKEQSVIKI